MRIWGTYSVLKNSYIQILPAQVKSLESKNSKKTQEVAELQHQLLQKEQQEQQNSKEVLDLKQKISTLEIGHDSAHKEVTMG